MLGDERFENRDNFFLLAARQLRNRLEKTAHFADGASTALAGGRVTEERINRNIKKRSERGEMIRLQRSFAAFPCRVAGLGDAEFLGHLGLRKPALLAGGEQPLTELRALCF